jgi:cardiolipin synthase
MQYVDGNRLTLLRNGEQYFPALVAAIDAAADEIFLETYIYAGDQTGSLVTDALARAAARGVAVHVLIDGYGSSDFPPRFRRILRDSGAQLRVFRPVRIWSLQRDRLRRLHRKNTSIDGRMAFVGGINIVDDYEGPVSSPPRFDYAVRVEGPLGVQVRNAAARLWSRLANEPYRPPAALAPGRMRDGVRVALVVRDSIRHRRDIERAYLGLIAGAHEEIVIANAYFLPGRRFRRSLVRAARRGVRVVLLMQGRVEFLLLHLASRAMYGQLLDAGIEIWEYRRGMLHAKVAVFDRVQACVGSSNLDPYSLLMALEANVFVNDRRFAGELRASLEEAIGGGADRIPPQNWRQRPLWQRVPIWAAYGITRLLIAFFSYERYR